VLVRSGDRWSAYDARTGALRWRRTMPGRTQFLPYGFTLGSVPLLDADHVLLGTTTALRVLDLRDGSMPEQAPLPTDGINTTYWPYQVVVTDRLVGVATNTGAVVLRR
jgi:outer membrane protein assembly factor BamB